MLTRFEGAEGRRLLVEAICSQEIVASNEELALMLVERGQLLAYEPGKEITVQGEADNSVYLLVEGDVSVEVNGRIIARRGAKECIGEMAAIDPSAPRSATVRATQATLALCLKEVDFQAAIANAPVLWKRLALVLAQRLRERERFHRTPNAMPLMFVGSSVEGLAVAREIAQGMQHDNVQVRLWSQPGVFAPGGTSIDTLLAEINSCDFAVMVFAPDDQIASRGATHYVPRDNVVFELGLFMGRLDRTRAFVVREHASDIKVPTDILGLTPIPYVMKSGVELASAVEPVCNELRKVIKKLGPR